MRAEPIPGFRKKNLFEIENARALSVEELASTFVPTQAFWRLLSTKHQIVLGSRGSGKTALARMLSHDHLRHLEHEFARDAVERRAYIGIYVPARLDWVGSLRSKPWQTLEEKEFYFQWRLNLASCRALLDALRSCLQCYMRGPGQRLRAERDLAHLLQGAWDLPESRELTQLDDVAASLRRLVDQRERDIIYRRITGRSRETGAGLEFDRDLFVPLRSGLLCAKEMFSLPDNTSWLLCIDEAESLDIDHHRILNSHLRTHSGDLFFKIATVPYQHYTLTTNLTVPLDVGHDFEYVYIDPDPILLSISQDEGRRRGSQDKRARIGTLFARTLFNKRVEASGGQVAQVSVNRLLGPSPLLDEKPGEWGPRSDFEGLLEKHVSQETLQRASKMRGDRRRFQSEIARKLKGALLLREAVASQKGRAELDVYSGATMAIRCGDANPRRLVRLFNSFLLEAQWYATAEGLTPRKITPKAQNRVLTKFSSSHLDRVQSEEDIGRELFEFLRMVGRYMYHCFHEQPLSTDQVSSLRLEQSASPSDWVLVKRAVGLGLLYPNVGPNNPDELPEGQGTFHLAYVLAPRFRLLPRRGKARNVNTIRTFARRHEAKPGDVDSSSPQVELPLEMEGRQ